MSAQPERERPVEDTTGLSFVDGRDALAYVLLRPSAKGAGHVIAEAGANGLSKKAAAAYLRMIADSWDPT